MTEPQSIREAVKGIAAVGLVFFAVILSLAASIHQLESLKFSRERRHKAQVYRRALKAIQRKNRALILALWKNGILS